MSAILVKGPVDTSHAVFGVHDMSASLMSLSVLQAVSGRLLGWGSRSVPSRPLSP